MPSRGAPPADKADDLDAEREMKMNTEMMNETAALNEIETAVLLFIDNKRNKASEVVEFDDWIERWVEGHPEDADWIVQAVKDRAAHDICFECFVEETINSIVAEGDIEIVSDEFVPLIQKKIMDSANGKYCGEHSALQEFDSHTAWQFLNFSTNFGWNFGDLDRDAFSEMLAEMDDEDFNECLAESLRGAVYRAEYLVYKDVLTNAKDRGAI